MERQTDRNVIATTVQMASCPEVTIALDGQNKRKKLHLT